MTKSWTLDVKEAPDGDKYIEFNDEILAETGWKEGDVIEWIDQGDGSFKMVKQETEMVMVECVSMFRMRYVVEVPKGKSEWALDTVTCNEAKEFSQEHIGEDIVSHRVVSKEEAIASAAQLATEMDLMAKMTGKSREEQQKQLKEAQNNANRYEKIYNEQNNRFPDFFDESRSRWN